MVEKFIFFSQATRMVDNGYVERFNDAEDRRIVRIRLTAGGSKLLTAAREQLKELFAIIVKRVPAIQRTALFFMLSDLTSEWQSVYEEQIASEQCSD